MRVVRVTEASAPASSTMHVRAVGLSEPFEVTLLPNPDYSGEHRIDQRARPIEPPQPARSAVEDPRADAQTEADGEAVPEADRRRQQPQRRRRPGRRRDQRRCTNRRELRIPGAGNGPTASAAAAAAG